MTEIFDFFTRNYPQFVSALTTALVCFLVFRFYLKAEGFSKEWTDFKSIYFPKVEEQLAKADDRLVILIEKIDERFFEFGKMMDERFAKADERFAKADERFVFLIEKIDERFARMDERFVKADERFFEFGKMIDQRFVKMDERLVRIDELFARLI